MALFIGFAPHLYFMPSVQKKQPPLFQKWLYYGLATIFSSVMLGVMAEISMDLVGNIAITDAVSNIAAALTGGNVGGIMQTVTQQLGLVLMLSTLLITVPPMAGAWFNGMMAGFRAYSVIGNGNRQEVPPHLDVGQVNGLIMMCRIPLIILLIKCQIMFNIQNGQLEVLNQGEQLLMP